MVRRNGPVGGHVPNGATVPASYGPPLDLQLFNQVSIDSEVKILVWPNGADFDPDTLHDWPTYQESFAAGAREWERVSA